MGVLSVDGSSPDSDTVPFCIEVGEKEGRTSAANVEVAVYFEEEGVLEQKEVCRETIPLVERGGYAQIACPVDKADAALVKADKGKLNVKIDPEDRVLEVVGGKENNNVERSGDGLDTGLRCEPKLVIQSVGDSSGLVQVDNEGWVIVNCDDDDDDNLEDNSDEILTSPDLEDVTRITLNERIYDIAISVDSSIAPHLRVFMCDSALDCVVLINPQNSNSGVVAARPYLYIESLDFPNSGFDGVLRLGITCRDENGIVLLDNEPLELSVAPFYLSSNLEQAEKLIVVNNPDHTTMPLVSGIKDIICDSNMVEIQSYDRWVQDEFEIGYTKTPNSYMNVVLNLPRDRGLDAAGPELISVVDDLGHYRIPVEYGGDGNYGGNLETSPAFPEYINGRLMLGNTISSDMAGFFTAQNVQNEIIVVDTDWLEVGHIDEIINIVPVPNTEDTSDYKIVIASPALALDLIRDVQNNGGGDISMSNPFGAFSPDDGGRLSINDILSSDYFITVNQNAEERISSAVGVLRDSLGVEESGIIKVPVLFYGLYSDHLEDCYAYTPDMVNLQVYNDKLIIPKQFGFSYNGKDLFEGYFSDQLSGLGLSVHFVDSWSYHQNMGGIHCGTNIIHKSKNVHM
ncbi:MAG: hypothetical protein JW724_02260 [Candidatus Altiarchaeota archaeon]|nr:hypothetical protein [Candidatus Altiarchaeota archaeon]